MDVGGGASLSQSGIREIPCVCARVCVCVCACVWVGVGMCSGKKRNLPPVF